jgi:ammonia channel protein AmtB
LGSSLYEVSGHETSPASLLIALVVRLLVGLRPGGEIESQGLDNHDHGEEGYTLNG